MMAEEQIVFKLDGPYLNGILGSFNPDFSTSQEVNGTFSVTTTPLGPGVTQPVTCADIHNLAISSSSSNQELCWKLIDFLTTSREVITTFLIPEGGMLPYRSYNLNPRLYGRSYADPINQTFINAVIPTMRAPAYGPRYSTAALAIAAAIQDVAQGAAVKPRLLRLTEEVKALYA
jgi:multiple sugar transport system substrate-binding protein